jgi:hypothetical protein
VCEENRFNIFNVKNAYVIECERENCVYVSGWKVKCKIRSHINKDVGRRGKAERERKKILN